MHGGVEGMLSMQRVHNAHGAQHAMAEFKASASSRLYACPHCSIQGSVQPSSRLISGVPHKGLITATGNAGRTTIKHTLKPAWEPWPSAEADLAGKARTCKAAYTSIRIEDIAGRAAPCDCMLPAGPCWAMLRFL